MFKTLFLLTLLSTSILYAEDAPQPSTKKESVSSIPHAWFSEGLAILKTQENRLAFANQPQDITSINFTNTRRIQPHFKWNAGLRIDLGYQPKDWYFFGNWTTITNYAKGSKSTNGTTGFFPLLTQDTSIQANEFVTSADMNWKLHTQLIELGAMISKTFKTHLILKPHVGLRTAFLDQRYQVDYSGGIFNQGMDEISMRNNFFGIGPIVGVSPIVNLGKGFSFVGDFSTSALIGHFFIKQNEKYLTNHLYHNVHSMNRLRWSIDAKAALNWQKEFLYKALVLSMQIGWEWHDFFGQNQLHQNHYHFFNNNRDLILRGGFLSICAAF